MRLKQTPNLHYKLLMVLVILLLTTFSCLCCTSCSTACEHSFTNYISNNDATCQNDGTLTAVCVKGDCVQTHTTTDAGSALGHVFTNYVSNGNVTCTSTGTKTAYCERKGCNQTHTVADDCQLLPHIYGAYQCNNDATCTNYGTKTAICFSCGDESTLTDTDNTPHHIFTDYINNNNSTCMQDGTATSACARDGCVSSDTIIVVGSKLGHFFEEYISNNDYTCTQNGTATALCSRSGCTATNTMVIANSSAHRFDGGICNYCNYVCTHSSCNEVTNAPSCTQEGSKGFLCNDCGKFMCDEVLNILPHNFSVLTTVSPTCNQTGSTCYQCSSCSAKRWVCTDSAVKHSYVDGACTHCGNEPLPYYCEAFQSLFSCNGFTLYLAQIDLDERLSHVRHLLPSCLNAYSAIEEVRVSISFYDGNTSCWLTGSLIGSTFADTATLNAYIEQDRAYCEVNTGSLLVYATLPSAAFIDTFLGIPLPDAPLINALQSLSRHLPAQKDALNDILCDYFDIFFTSQQLPNGRNFLLSEQKLSQFLQLSSSYSSAEIYDEYFDTQKPIKSELISLLAASKEYLLALDKCALLDDIAVQFSTDNNGLITGNIAVNTHNSSQGEMLLTPAPMPITQLNYNEFIYTCASATNYKSFLHNVNLSVNGGVTSFRLDQTTNQHTLGVEYTLRNVGEMQYFNAGEQEFAVTVHQVTEYNYTITLDESVSVFVVLKGDDKSITVLGTAVGVTRYYLFEEIHDSLTNALYAVRYIHEGKGYEEVSEEWWTQIDGLHSIVIGTPIV